MSTDALLQFCEVSKSFSKLRGQSEIVLKNITFKVNRGELLSIVGPTGCGKSTLLRLAAGLEVPTSGTVLFEGEAVVRPSLERGFVFQAYSAFPWLTVRQNIEFGLEGKARQNCFADVQHWLQAMGLTAFADSFPRELSGGMRQRLALARALIVKPKLLLMDEPFGALDENTRASMQQLLLEIMAMSGCTVLFVTHDLREAILLSNRILLLTSRPGSILHEFVPPLQTPDLRNKSSNPQVQTLYQELLDSFPNDALQGEL